MLRRLSIIVFTNPNHKVITCIDIGTGGTHGARAPIFHEFACEVPLSDRIVALVYQ